MNENEPKETDSMDDLRQVKSDPFSFWDGLKRWIFRDSFRSIQLSVVLASVLLTIALIFDSQLGAGPIAQHGAVASSNAECSKFAADHLKRTRNSYDAAILCSLCLLATNKAQVSLAGGGMAAVHFINSTDPSHFYDFTARKSQNKVPAFMAGILKLKSLADEKVEKEKLNEKTIYTHSNIPMTNTDLGTLIMIARDFIEQKIQEDHGDFLDVTGGQDNTELLKTLIVLSKNPRSFYDKGDSELERGDLWSIITHNGERPGAVDMLDFDKNIQKTYAYSLNLTQGKIDAHPDSIKVLIALGVIDKRNLERTDARFPLLVANSLYQSANLSSNQIINFPMTVKKITDNIINKDDHIPQGKDWDFSPWETGIYQAAYVTVIGDDAEIIGLTFTVGKKPFGDCISYDNIKYCFSDYEGLKNDIFPAPILVRPNCGVCGRYTIIAGDPVAEVNFGSEVIKRSGLFDADFSERVKIDQSGVVIVEAGMPSQYPEMWDQIESHSIAPKLAPKGEAIGFACAVEWKNDGIHAISDKRLDPSWPASVF